MNAVFGLLFVASAVTLAAVGVFGHDGMRRPGQPWFYPVVSTAIALPGLALWISSVSLTRSRASRSLARAGAFGLAGFAVVTAGMACWVVVAVTDGFDPAWSSTAGPYYGLAFWGFLASAGVAGNVGLLRAAARQRQATAARPGPHGSR